MVVKIYLKCQTDDFHANVKRFVEVTAICPFVFILKNNVLTSFIADAKGYILESSLRGIK